MKRLRIKLSKLENKVDKINKRLLDVRESDVVRKLSRDYKDVLSEIRTLNDNINRLEKLNSEYELESELDFPEYDAFLNFFKDIVKTIENTNNVYLIDQIVKFVFVNLVVGDKKVLGYELSEPFKTYNSLKILSGVDDGA